MFFVCGCALTEGLLSQVSLRKDILFSFFKAVNYGEINGEELKWPVYKPK